MTTPYDETTDVGPVIDEAAAERVERWVNEAGGTATGAFFAPTVIADVPADAKVTAEEVFGPVLVLIAAKTDDEAFEGLRSAMDDYTEQRVLVLTGLDL